jgi:hypothetical protein
MNTLNETAVAQAFALTNAKGADLLVELGQFGVWSGDLGAMRGDDPHVPAPENDQVVPRSADLAIALRLARAIELLTPTCRESLSALYRDKNARLSRVADRDRSKTLSTCEQLLQELYDSLPGDSAALPSWAAETKSRVS